MFGLGRKREVLTNWFRHTPRRDEASTNDIEPVRGWGGANTTRLNSAHWGKVTSADINSDLSTQLGVLRDRCRWEAQNNPLIEGIISSHVSAVVGIHGPTLQVQSDGDKNAYGDAVEGVWKDKTMDPVQWDMAEQSTLPDMLRLWVRACWIDGCWLVQKVRDGGFRLNNIAPRKLVSPAVPKSNIILGVERNDYGKPLTYHIQKGAGQTAPIPAADIIHGFLSIEPGQVTGAPWLAPAVQIIADPRDYDEQVLDAARAAADYAVYMFSTDPTLAVQTVNDEVEIKRRVISTLPPGYQIQQLDPKQPSTAYVEYRNERMRDIGRAVSMPLMMVKLDASGHNYSSARFDGQLYNRMNSGFQAYIERSTLTPLVGEVEREATLAQALPKRPEKVIYRWIWDAPPHVDPLKEAKAAGERMDIKTSTLADELAAQGKDFDAHIAQLIREKLIMEAGGLNITQKPQPNNGRSTDDLVEEIIDALNEEHYGQT